VAGKGVPAGHDRASSAAKSNSEYSNSVSVVRTVEKWRGERRGKERGEEGIKRDEEGGREVGRRRRDGRD
jgi:hypothetical protein